MEQHERDDITAASAPAPARPPRRAKGQQLAPVRLSQGAFRSLHADGRVARVAVLIQLADSVRAQSDLEQNQALAALGIEIIADAFPEPLARASLTLEQIETLRTKAWVRGIEEDLPVFTGPIAEGLGTSANELNDA
jgi:hypothetical protein